MFGKLKTFLYTEVYINVIADLKKTTIYVEEVYSKSKSHNYEEVFETAEQNKINRYITQMSKKSPLHYISVLDTSIFQGATPTCKSVEMAPFCDLGVVSHICYTKQWGYYTSKMDVHEYQKRYAKVGIDYLFSPFLLLVNFFKEKISEDLSLYILIDNDFISLSVFNNSKLLFAQQIDMDNQNEFQDELLAEDDMDEEELTLDGVSINLEDIDVTESMEDLDDFDNIEDLDTFDEMDEFSEDEDEEIGDNAEDEEINLEDNTGFGDDYHRFSLIQSAIKKFYMDDIFKSDFVQKVYIADAVGMSNELKKFLEEEMYLNVFIRKIDLGVELCEAAKAEKR